MPQHLRGQPAGTRRLPRAAGFLQSRAAPEVVLAGADLGICIQIRVVVLIQVAFLDWQ